jgi:hypothetical protein
MSDSQLHVAQKAATALLGPAGGSVGIGKNDDGKTALFVHFMEWPSNMKELPDEMCGFPIVYARIGEIKKL